MAAVALGAIALTACSNSSRGIAGPAPSSPPSSTHASASPTSAPTDSRESLLRQYSAFWQTLAPASQAPAAQRALMLGAVAADPELHSLLRGIDRERSRGRAFYGAATPRPRITQFSPEQQLAVIDDCQDARASGVQLLANHRRLTTGTAREHVVATLHLGNDRRWRVAFISFPKTSC